MCYVGWRCESLSTSGRSYSWPGEPDQYASDAKETGTGSGAKKSSQRADDQPMRSLTFHRPDWTDQMVSLERRWSRWPFKRQMGKKEPQCHERPGEWRREEQEFFRSHCVPSGPASRFQWKSCSRKEEVRLPSVPPPKPESRYTPEGWKLL